MPRREPTAFIAPTRPHPVPGAGPGGSTVVSVKTDPVALTVALCDLASVRGDGGLADAIEATIAHHGHLECSRLGDTIVARTTAGHARRLIVAGHLDSTPIASRAPVRVWDVQGIDTLFGRGVADMKGGLAVMLCCLTEQPPAVDVTWIFSGADACGRDLGGIARLQRERPDLLEGDAAVVCEPTDATIELGCKGSLHATVATTGTAAHAARDWMGVNAIDLALPALAAIEAHDGDSVAIDGLAYRECVNVVQVAGGRAPDLIPDRCELTVAYRFAPDKSVADAERVLTELLPDFDVVVSSAAEGAPPNAGPLAEVMAALDAPIAAAQGWSDVARFAALGVPALNYGPGSSLTARADEEQCPVTQIHACAAGLRRLLGLDHAPPRE